ncbi:hypothetical protein pb186bvf_016965 [Paramecium bursaria]
MHYQKKKQQAYKFSQIQFIIINLSKVEMKNIYYNKTLRSSIKCKVFFCNNMRRHINYLLKSMWIITKGILQNCTFQNTHFKIQNNIYYITYFDCSSKNNKQMDKYININENLQIFQEYTFNLKILKSYQLKIRQNLIYFLQFVFYFTHFTQNCFYQIMNQLSIDQDPTKRTNKLFMMSFFLMLGVSGLSGWNSILVGMNYFNLKFKGMQSEFYLPIPNYIGLTLFGIMMPKLSNYVSLQIRIALSLFLISLLILLLPIVAQLLPNQEGFYIDFMICFFIGMVSCFIQSSSIGLASMYGSEYIAIFYVGIGLSGILISSFQFVSLYAIPSPEISIFITLSISALMNIIAIIMFFVFKKTSIYKRGELMKKQNQSVFDQDNQVSLINSQNLVKLKQMGFLKTFWYINKIAFPIPLLILILYFQTFMMFPAIAIQKQFPSNFQGWGIAIIVQCFNFGDTIGKALAGFRVYSKFCLIVFIIIRVVQFYPFFLIADSTITNDIITNDYIAYTNMFSFALIHGYISTGLMQIGPQMSSEPYIKEKIGFVNACSLFFGITLGCMMAPILKTYYLT